jgi:hypothetical protein
MESPYNGGGIMKLGLRRLYVAIIGILLLNFAISAQIRESGAVQGQVLDKANAPLPGATVTATGSSLIGGPKIFITDARGFFRFPSLPIGSYAITAELAGFGKSAKEGVQIHPGLTLTIDFVLEESSISKEIEVVGQAPTIDIKNSSTGTVVMTSDLLLSLPSGKNMMDVMNLAPGTDYFGAFGTGYGSPNSYQIDGISVRSPGWGGSFVEPDFNIIKESSVQSFGLPAEYGEFTGVVFNTITKSGSNEFSGMAEVRHNAKNWNSQNIVDVPTEKLLNPAAKDVKQLSNYLLDVGFQLGGPIIKDKLWFFGSAQYYKTRSYPVGTPVVPESNSPKVFGKLTFALSKSNTVNVTFNYDNERATNILSSMNYAPEVNLNNDFPGYFVIGTWTSILSPNTFADFKLGYNFKKQAQMPAAGRDISGHYDVVLGLYTQNYSSFFYNAGSTLDINAHLSHYVSDLLGSHDIKFGVENQYSSPGQRGGYNGIDHSYYQDQNGLPYLKYQYASDWDFTHHFNVFIAFLQDSWSVSKRLTVNFGLRLDNYWYNIPNPGVGTILKDTEIAPRFGISYDLFGDRKNVLKFHYGHYFDSLYRTYFGSAETRRPDQVQMRWDGTQYVEFNRVVFRSQYSTDPNIKAPYTQEIMAGYERELFKNASLGATFFYRKLIRAIGSVNTLGEYTQTTVVNPGPDGTIGTSDDSTINAWNQTNPGQNFYLITNPRKGLSQAITEDPKHSSLGFELVFNKRMSNRWQLMASYTYLRAKGNIERPPVFDLGMDPNRFINSGGFNVRYAGQPHYLKVQTNIILPLDISLGMNAFYISGHSYRPYFSTFLNQGNVTIYAEPWGDNKVDPQRNIDLRIEKAVKIGNYSVSVFGQIFNLLNGHETRWDYDVFGGYGANYQKILAVIAPRSYQLGLRFMF